MDLQQSGFGRYLTKNHLCKRAVFLKPHPHHIPKTDPHINVSESNWQIYCDNFMNFSKIETSDHFILQTYHPDAELVLSNISD